jgi:CheY-like chemotaxis protein
VASNFGTILAVDDDEWDLEALHDAIVAGGYQVITATDGNSALALFLKQSTDIDLVVSDHQNVAHVGMGAGSRAG